jgi:hypothetical protein
MTIVYAVEAWVLALASWGWLVVMEMWAWSLLGAHVFYGLIWLSSCNLVMTGIYPDSLGPRSAYFAAVLAFALHSACCVLDTVTPGMGTAVFESPTNSTSCTLPKTQQLFFFNGSQFYLAQAGATLGYLVVQLILAGASMLDSERHTLWVGSSWGGGLGMLLCARFLITFDGLAKGVSGNSRYFQLFSLPIMDYTVLFTFFLYVLAVLVGIEGLLFPGLGWRKTVRYISFGLTVPFVCFVFYVLVPKGMLTPGVLVLLLLILGLGVFSLVEAILARPVQITPEVPAPTPPPYQGWAAPSAPVFPQWPPNQVVQPWGQTGKQASAHRSRLFIPNPVEMLDEKNKRV